MAKTTNIKVRRSAYPHHFNHSAPKPERTYSNPQKRLYVKYQGMVITTRPCVAEIMSAVPA